jgi:hypothetical protein
MYFVQPTKKVVGIVFYCVFVRRFSTRRYHPFAPGQTTPVDSVVEMVVVGRALAHLET